MRQFLLKAKERRRGWAAVVLSLLALSTGIGAGGVALNKAEILTDSPAAANRTAAGYIAIQPLRISAAEVGFRPSQQAAQAAVSEIRDVLISWGIETEQPEGPGEAPAEVDAEKPDVLIAWGIETEPPEEPTEEPEQPEEQPEQLAEAPSLEGKKLVALTFDDGPSAAFTPRLLDMLEKEDVKATFFVLGCNVKAHPQVVLQIAEAGHQIGSHTMNHKNLTKLSAAELRREIDATATAIEALTGTRPTAMRPPYGAYNDQVLERAGAAVILWSVEPEDWKYRNADTVYCNVVGAVSDGDIVLLHDIYGTSVAAAERIIQDLKAEGYAFVTVEELLRARGGEVAGRAYRQLRP